MFYLGSTNPQSMFGRRIEPRILSAQLHLEVKATKDKGTLFLRKPLMRSYVSLDLGETNTTEITNMIEQILCMRLKFYSLI